jgi:phospholipase C
MPPNVRRMLSQQSPATKLAARHETRRPAHAGKPLVRSLLRNVAGVRGFDDPEALRLADRRSVFYQPDNNNPKGYLLPFRLDTHATSAQKIPSTSHAWAVQDEVWNGGRMDRWLSAHRKANGVHGPYCMGYYTREDIPFQFALAEAFTLCDAITVR